MTKEELLQLINKAADEGSTELDLSGLGLKELPPEIGKLSNLTQLDLSHNQITEIPEVLGKLSNLT
ncbi:leucine-rich repeat domain-containing protein, partial [Tychonema sp. BBK16]